MSTTPTPIVTSPGPLTKAVTTYSSFLKAHETLVIIVLSAFLLFRAGQGIENIILKHDETLANKAGQVVQQDAVTNKQLQDQLAQLKASADAQSKQLNADITLKLAQLTAQQKKDSVSTPPEIDARWQELLPLKPGSITPIDPSTTSVTNDAANQTVQALESVPVLKQQVSDLTTELSNDQKVIIQQDGVITGLKQQVVDDAKKDETDVKAEKAKSKHQFWKGFKIGVVVGAVGTEAIRIWVGHP